MRASSWRRSRRGLRAVLVLLVGAAALASPFLALADGPTTRDVATTRVELDGTTSVERQIEYTGFLAERGATDAAVLERMARDRLAAYGAADIQLQIDPGPERVRL